MIEFIKSLEWDKWVILGFIAQFCFFSRFIVQWIASERKNESVIPIGFWYLSIIGGLLLFIYSIHTRNPVFILGQSMGPLIYSRNLYLIYKKKNQEIKATS
ncbi:MAG: lipid-A-disaccharide synthase N-terminal domain-containing protein [Candidatus Aureabacteria bacterium]|nr:lipid-A-disaccharide synthase N-terminal domain-containing protein [Candidatus Auribacterota bacterium]